MKKLYHLKLTSVLLFFITINTELRAQNIHMVDINTIKNSYPSNLYENAFAELNGVFYFTADDGIHGSEIWRSDGTAQGTNLVKDIVPGSASSDPNEIVASGSNVYFTAFQDNVVGLYVSDGTLADTHFLVDVESGINLKTNVNGILYFLIYHNFSEPQLWKTDGTAAGTIMVADLFAQFNANGFLGTVGNLKNVNGKLFFTLQNDVSGNELYSTDGTTAGTQMVADINPGSNSSTPGNFTVVNDKLYFSADDGSGSQLWVTDGTSAGTHLINNTNGIYIVPSYLPANFALEGNILYFAGSTAATGIELCKYDPSDPANSVSLVKDLNPGTNNSYPGYFIDVNGTLLFITYSDNTGFEGLWKTDGTSEGTALLKESDQAGFDFSNLVNVNGILMFNYFSNSLGFELWKSDGTNEGTTIVKDINAGPGSGLSQYYEDFNYQNGILLFNASDGKSGVELWKSDGTKEGTQLVKDINQTSSASSNPSDFTATTGNKAIFQAYTDKYGNEVWISDGTAAGTKLVKDIFPGSPNSYDFSSSRFFTEFKNKTYFFAYDTNDSTGYKLWETNGTKAGTYPVSSLNINELVDNMVATGSFLYFTLFNYNTGFEELWRSDGTSSGTFILKANTGGFYPNATAVGNTLFFAASDDIHGNELWKSDGTIAGTVLVKDINPGIDGSYPSALYNFNNKLYFQAYDGLGGFLWTSDGTDAGTKIVKALNVGYGFAQANGKLFFNGYNIVSKGYELYASDGTAAGTKLVKDINRGPASSNIYTFVSGEGLLYFTADDGRHGAEIWKSDGTKPGTQLVKDITPGIDPTYPSSLVNIHDKLFFTLNDTLWQSDGTKKGTVRVNDLTLDGVSALSNLKGIGDYLYFSGTTYTAGNELYIARIPGSITPIAMNEDRPSISAISNNSLEARLLTNPVSDQLKFSVTVKQPQAAQVLITDASGRLFKNQRIVLSAGTNMFSYEVKEWIQGIYMVRIIAPDGSSSLLKAAK